MTNSGPPASPRNLPGVDLGDPDLNNRISRGLADVEETLRSRLSTGESFITDKITHLAEAGGKRFRPMMALLASQFGSRPGSSNVIKAAVIVEIVHLATLYHDDVMDEADKRRGVESANARWGNSVAILSGDILLAHASRLMSELDTTTVSHFADTFEELVTGQMRETIGSTEGLSAVDHYMKVIYEKTGVLIASSAFLGAYHSGVEGELLDVLYELGADIGVIFQIVDDMIDIYSETGQSGKIPGTDLREGVFTLPVLFALEEETPVGEELRGLLTGPLTDEDDVERALDLLHRSSGRERTMSIIEGLLERAETRLEQLPDGAATTALRRLSHFTVQRVG